MLGMHVVNVNEGCTINSIRPHPSPRIRPLRRNRVTFYAQAVLSIPGGSMAGEVSRRKFFGTAAATVGVLGLTKSPELFAQAAGTQTTATTQRFGGSDADYDKMVKLASNENNYGPPKAVMDSMQGAWKYANRYGYPDGDVVEVIAAHHGLKPENVLLTAGSGEVLQVVGTTYLSGGKKVVGADPSYGSVYQHASHIKRKSE